MKGARRRKFENVSIEREVSKLLEGGVSNLRNQEKKRKALIPGSIKRSWPISWRKKERMGRLFPWEKKSFLVCKRVWHQPGLGGGGDYVCFPANGKSRDLHD